MKKNSQITIVLLSPEIPQNTGAIGRMCVCLGAHLILIKPLGYSLDEKHLKRAGLDYWQFLDYTIYDNWSEFLKMEQPQQMLFASTEGTRPYYDFQFNPDVFLIFGNESSGLPLEFHHTFKDHLYMIPMPGEHSRSHNLANAVSIIAYEAYRQIIKPF